MQLTCNQVILLLDCRRGFLHTRHPATLARDIKILRAEDLIVTSDDPPLVLTPFGAMVANHIIKQSTWHKSPGPECQARKKIVEAMNERLKALGS